MLNYDLRENVFHGSKEFPVSLYTIPGSLTNNQILPCHWHEDFEILYVYEGTGHFRIDNTSVTLNKGQAYIVNSRELHSGYTMEGQTCSYYALVFDLKLLQSTMEDFCTQEYIKPLLLKEKKLECLLTGETPQGQQCLHVLDSILSAYSIGAPYYQLYIKGQLYTLLFMLYTNAAVVDCSLSTSARPGVNLDAVKDALNYIDIHFSEKISIDAIAGAANLSKFHFIRVFKAATAMNPTDYINMIRINEAEKYFQTTSLSITDVAGCCGFNNLSYFIKTFKNYKKITPSRYKKILQSKTAGFHWDTPYL